MTLFSDQKPQMHVGDLRYSQPFCSRGEVCRLYDDFFHPYGPGLKIPVDVYGKGCRKDAKRPLPGPVKVGREDPAIRLTSLQSDPDSAYQQKTPERVKEKSQPAISHKGTYPRR